MKRTSNCSMKGIILLILALTPTSLGQKYSFGSCQSLQSFASTVFYQVFDAGPNDFYVYAISPSLFFHQWNCLTFVITQTTQFVSYSVTITGTSKLTGATLNAAGTLTISGHLATGTTGTSATATTDAADVFTFTFSDGWKTYAETFYLLDATTNYLVFYGCENYGFGKKESAFILVTSATTTPSTVTAALNALAARGYPLHALRRAYVGCA